LSPSTINLFCDCPRCFYLHMKMKLSRPRGIFPSLPGGIDRVLRAYFDKYRDKGELPPNMKGLVPGKPVKELPGQLKYYDEGLAAQLSGKLDELLEMDDGTYSVLDFKTRGSSPNEMIPAYQNQMDLYTFLLDKNTYKMNGSAYLAYFFPKSADGNNFEFELEIKKLSVDTGNAKKLFSDAVKTLQTEQIPDPDPECEYCAFEYKRRDLK